jgi:hypothetical protein
MTKLVSTLAIVVLGLVALGAVGPRIAVILHAMVPVILVCFIAVVGIRMVWWLTRRW